jgi:cytochrome c biogenesis protein CcdA
VSTLDFNTPPAGHKFTASIEREETDGERRVRLGKEIALFAVAIAFVMLIVGYCFSVVVSSTASADAQKWAMSVLTAAVGGLLGFLVKK